MIYPPKPAIKVLLVDDNITILQQVKELITIVPGIEVIGEARDGLEVITKARALKPHLVLMDVRLPGQNGLEATRQLKHEMPEIKVIVLALFDLPIYRDTALANGAGDYVIKKAMRKELLPAIQRVMQTDQPAETADLKSTDPTRQLSPNNPAKQPQFQTQVLVVEDNLINQKIAQVLLEQLGCRVDLATNGREALESPNRWPYDLVFMDCEMPEMDGFETTVEIRRRYADFHIPIIAMTAGTQPDQRAQYLAVGMDDYLSKPVHLAELAGLLARWVPNPSPDPFMEKTLSEPASLAKTEEEQTDAALDPETIQRLKNLAQATETLLFTQLLETFQHDAAALIMTLSWAVALDDRVNLRKTAHHLKGASLTIGAHNLGNICRHLESLDNSQAKDAASALIAQLEQEFSRVKAEIKQELNR